MNSIKFDNPWLLLLAIPLIALVIVGFFIVPKQKRFRPKNIISLCLHLVIAVTLSFSFANMQFLTSSKKVELYLVADCSDSQEGNAAQIEETIKKVYSSANSQTSVGVIAFGKDQKIVTSLGSSYRDDTIASVFQDSSFDGSATDIYSAMNYANEQFSEDAIKRVILITDGIETDNSAMNAIDKLLANGVTIDTVSLNEVSGDEVAITGIDYNDHCFVGREEIVKVYIRSRKQVSNAAIQITSGGSVLADGSQLIDLSRGLNTVSFKLDTSTEGSKDYQISISCPGSDTYTQNNVRSFTQDYTSKFSVLFIGSTNDELTSFRTTNNFTDDQIKSYIGTTTVPYKLSELVEYDEIVLSNTDVTTLDNTEEFVSSLNRAVSEYGKTLMTYGQTYSGQEGNAIASTYNDLLPVQYKTDDAKALVLLIDNSGSMSTDSRLTKAKKGAIKMLDILGENDMVSIIGFESNVKVYQPLTSAKNKDQIIKAINKISEGGGTMMNPGLTQSRKQLQDIDIEYKNVITLSDGDPSESDSTLLKTVRAMAADNIRCSFINISNANGASLLKKLANAGNGSYYYVRTASSLENVILTSVSSNMANQPITEDGPYNINIKDNTDAVFTGVDPSKLQQISGYYFCRQKSGATNILTVQYKKEVEDENGNKNIEVVEVPLYAYWDYGKGRVASFTSDIGLNWTANFRASEAGSGFLKGMVTQNLPSRSATSQLDITYSNNGFTSDISVLAADNDAEARAHVVVKDPNGQEKGSYDFYYDGSYYSGEITLSFDGNNKVIAGKYTIDVTYQKKDASGNYQDNEKASFPLQYDCSKEYDSFSDSNSEATLYRIAKYANGTYSSADNFTYTATGSEVEVQSYNSTMFFFLIFSVVLYVIDIFLRKTEIKNLKKKKQPMGM